MEAIDFDQVANLSMRKTSSELLLKNRQQLLEGKRRDGADITPSYFNDTYFKTRAAGRRYSDWKDKITPNPKRRRGTPNLYINGFHHRTIKLKLTGMVLTFFGAFKQREIEQKYTEMIYGLNAEKRVEYLNESLRPEFEQKTELLTGLKFKKRG